MTSGRSDPGGYRPSPALSWAPRTPGRRFALAFVLSSVLASVVALAIAARSDARADIRVVTIDLFPLREGVTIVFATQQVALGAAAYWTRIDLIDVDPDAATYAYTMYGGEMGARTSAGEIEILDRRGCTALNPWWGAGQPTVREEWCDLWLSQEAFVVLAEHDAATFDLDLTARTDSGLSLRTLRRDEAVVEIDGHLRALPALVVESAAGDELWVLDDRDNPFVLRARIDGIYTWQVMSIHVTTDAPDVEPFAPVTLPSEDSPWPGTRR